MQVNETQYIVTGFNTETGIQTSKVCENLHHALTYKNTVSNKIVNAHVNYSVIVATRVE